MCPVRARRNRKVSHVRYKISTALTHLPPKCRLGTVLKVPSRSALKSDPSMRPGEAEPAEVSTALAWLPASFDEGWGVRKEPAKGIDQVRSLSGRLWQLMRAVNARFMSGPRLPSIWWHRRTAPWILQCLPSPSDLSYLQRGTWWCPIMVDTSKGSGRTLH